MVQYCVVHCPAHVTRVCVPVEHFYQFPALLENWFLSCKGNAQGRHVTGDMNGQQCCYDLSACTSMQNSNYSVKERLGLHWINLIHFVVISACIHSDYLSICAVLDIHITDITVSHSCPRAAHYPLHACAGANCLHYLDISYLRWRAVRPGSRGPGCCWSNCSTWTVPAEYLSICIFAPDRECWLFANLNKVWLLVMGGGAIIDRKEPIKYWL